MNKQRLAFNGFGLLLALACALTVAAAAIIPSARTAARSFASDEAEARRAVEQAFERLRAGEYAALYDVLPTASQKRITRARFVSGLERTRGLYELERIEVGAVRVSGNLAVADTVMYGRTRQPFAGEGKIVVRQYMMREGGQWRVATGDRSTLRPLLAANPKLARQFPPTEPRVYLKRGGGWVDVRTLAAPPRRRTR